MNISKGADMNATKTYRIAALFAMDHYDRGCGETDRVIRQTKNHYTVEMDAAGFSDMLTDADYYWEFRGEMDGVQGICRSAKRVLDALLEQGPPPGYVITKRGDCSYRVVPTDSEVSA